jgi:hypothetical protein
MDHRDARGSAGTPPAVRALPANVGQKGNRSMKKDLKQKRVPKLPPLRREVIRQLDAAQLKGAYGGNADSTNNVGDENT